MNTELDSQFDSLLPSRPEEVSRSISVSPGVGNNFPAYNADEDVLLNTAEAVVTTSFSLNLFCRHFEPAQIGKVGFWQLIYLTSAIQPALNGWTAFEWLFAKNKCSVGDPECYMQWDGSVSVWVYMFVFCTFYANYRIALEFMPDTFKTILNLLDSMRKQLLLLSGIRDNEQPVVLDIALVIRSVIFFSALLLAGSGATVTFVLGRESLVLFKAASAWLNVALLVTAVASTLSTRFISCRAMLNIFYQRQLSYLHVDAPLRWLGFEKTANFYRQRRWLLTGFFDLYFYEYQLPAKIWNDISEQLKSKDYVEAFTTLYAASEDESWPGLLAQMQSSYLKQFGYYAALFTCYFFALASYPIIYNISRKAFAEWAPWHNLSYIVVFSSTLFYVYAMGRLPDQVAREIMMSSSVAADKKYARWAMLFWGMIMGMASCGNLLYPAMSQVDAGLLDHVGLTHEQAMIFFPIVGAVISGGCNLYATLSIDERHAVPERYHASAKLFKNLNEFIEDSSPNVSYNQAEVEIAVSKAYGLHFAASSWCNLFTTPSSEPKQVYAPLLARGSVDTEESDPDASFCGDCFI